MADKNFDFCVNEVLKSEGGYTNDPHDPGGATNFGITIHDYRAYIDAHGTAANVKAMTVDQAKAIYRSKYWNTVQADTLPSGVDYCVFDYGVNSGVHRAVSVANSATTRQYAARKDIIWLIDQICDERLAFLKGLKTWKYFGKGWSTRVAHVRGVSKIMAKEVINTLQPMSPQAIATRAVPTWTTRIKNWLWPPKQS